MFCFFIYFFFIFIIIIGIFFFFFFFFKQKTAYEITASDWSSDVCSSDLDERGHRGGGHRQAEDEGVPPREGRRSIQQAAPHLARVEIEEDVRRHAQQGAEHVLAEIQLGDGEEVVEQGEGKEGIEADEEDQQ